MESFAEATGKIEKKAFSVFTKKKLLSIHQTKISFYKKEAIEYSSNKNDFKQIF